MHRSLARWSWWVSRSCRVVIIVYGPAAGLTGHVTANIRIPGDGLLAWGWGIVVSLLRELRLTWLFYDLVTILIGVSIVGFLAVQGLVFLEGRKTAFIAILLFSLAFRLGFDGVHPYLIDVWIITRLEISGTAPLAFPRWSAVQTTSPTTEEDAAEEEEDPGSDSEPDGVTDRSAAAGAVYPGFCQEEKGKVEDEGDHSHSCGEAGNAGTATCHGHFSNVGEKAERSRARGQNECNDVEDKTVRYPFNDDVGKLDPCVISKQGVDICRRDRVAGPRQKAIVIDGRQGEELVDCTHQARSPPRVLNR